MALLDKPDFTDNVGLQALRDAWRENHEHFEQDRFGTYPVDPTIDLLTSGQPRASRHSREMGDFQAQRGAQPSDRLGLLRKTCELCDMPSRNNPCDSCYAEFREVIEPSWGFGLATKFCVVCFSDADESGKLCSPCRRLLSDPA